MNKRYRLTLTKREIYTLRTALQTDYLDADRQSGIHETWIPRMSRIYLKLGKLIGETDSLRESCS